MATARDMLSKKGSDVQCIRPSATVLEATQVMNRHKVGCLVVLEGERIVGIFTERDVLRRVVAAELPPSRTCLSEVMTHDVQVCTGDTDLDELRNAMMTRRIRHMPVVDSLGGLLGIISIGDLNAWEAEGREEAIHSLSEYIYGRV